MIKAIPRSWIDITTTDIISILFQLLNTKEAVNNNKVHEFEKAFSQYIGTKDAVSFSSFRAAAYFALKALKLEEEDEVILPAFTFWVDAAMIVLAGLKPVFVDVDFNTANIDPAKIEEKITKKTKVIFLTHLNGLPADIEPIMEIAKRYNLRIIEDCARSCGTFYGGRRLGSFGIGVFSFSYAKNIHLFGGGMVTSSDQSLIERLRASRDEFKRVSVKKLLYDAIKGCIFKYLNIPLLYGISLFPMAYQYKVCGNQRYASLYKVKMPSYDNVPDAFMTSMSNLQAKLGICYLKMIDGLNEKRSENSKILKEELYGISGLHIFKTPYAMDGETLYCALWSNKKTELQHFLFNNRIDASDESALDLTQLDRFKPYSKNTQYPNAAKLNEKVIFLPAHPFLRNKDMHYITDKIKEFYKER